MTAEDSIAMIDAMRAVIYLYLYLVTKSHAMKCRLKGDIEYALRHEEACDLLYDQLPEQVRW